MRWPRKLLVYEIVAKLRPWRSHSLMARSEDPEAMTPTHECPTSAVSAGGRFVLGDCFATSAERNGLDVFRKS